MLFWMVDAFTHSLFEGNQAAVFWTENKLPPGALQKIAGELNVHEAIFLSPSQNQHFHTQIFTPFAQESVCGHGLLAAAHVLWNELNPENIDHAQLYFDTNLGIFRISLDDGKMTVHTTAKMPEPSVAPERLMNALGVPPISINKCGQIYVVEMFNPKQVLKLQPDIAKLEKIPCKGVVVTAEGGNDVEYDFISRFFAPSEGFKEDPVTLWNHCFLAPYWSRRLKKNTFRAFQTAKRSGWLDIICENEQVLIRGQCITSAAGKVSESFNWALHNDLFDSFQ
ncbi:putative isomerase [Alphaproteobacteria bacterium]|nr:putative isomerase [Alphaproteobacteria bacterium]